MISWIVFDTPELIGESFRLGPSGMVRGLIRGCRGSVLGSWRIVGFGGFVCAGWRFFIKVS